MYVTATEFKAKFGKYAELAQTEEIHVMKRGKELFRVTPPEKRTRRELVEAMRGVLPLNDETKDITVADIRAERRKRYEYPG